MHSSSKYILRLVFLFFLLDSCIDPIDVKIPEIGFQLVVDGSITTEPGPYTVKLYRARPLKTDLDRLIAERLAKVQIKDDAGNVELLTETSDGIYQTKATGIRGTIGRSYSVEITTVTGKKYTSTPELISPVGTVDDIHVEYSPKSSVTQSAGYRVFADATGVASSEDLVRFRMVGTYEIETFPHKRIKMTEGGPVPDPFPCSGYVVEGGTLKKSTDCTCCVCWVNDYDQVPVVSDEEFSANTFNDVEVGYVPITATTFFKKYHVEVQLLSLTENAYRFWKLIRSQKNGVSDLFQPAVSDIKGNIIPNNPDDEPLGYFFASAITSKSIFLSRQDLPEKVGAIDTVIAPCRYFPYSTSDKPTFW